MDYSSSSNDKAAAAAVSDPQDSRSNPVFWHRWAKDAWEHKAARRHRVEAKAAWDEYQKTAGDNPEKSDSDKYERCNPAYWEACKTIEPAYYAKKPRLRAKIREGMEGAGTRRAGKYAKNLGTFLIDACEFDECFGKVVQEYIHADKALPQICYDADIVAERVVVPPDSQIPEGVKLLQDPATLEYYYEHKRATNQRIYPKAVLYDEVIHTPTAKCWSEVVELGFKFCLSKEEALRRFPDLGSKIVNWKKGVNETEGEESGQLGEYLEGWEIYCEVSRHIYWISSACPNDFLDKKGDEWELRGFFPAPRAIIGSTPAKHLYPTPIFVQLSGYAKQMHMGMAKIFELIKAIRRRALIDGSVPELVTAFEDLNDNEFITVENLAHLVEKAQGNIQNLIWYLPVQELVNAIKELIELDRVFREKFDIAFGTPDIVRGVSDPSSTATQDTLAAGAAHDRFRFQKAQVQKLVADTIEMMVDLALKMFEEEKLNRIFGFDPLSASPEETEEHVQALAILKNDEERFVRLDIETDSTSFVNDALDAKERNTVAATLMGGLKEIGMMLSQGAPEYAAVALDTLIYVLDGIRGGGEMVESLKGRSQELLKKAMAPKPNLPPPPDYEAMKIQLKQTELEMKDADSQRKAQLKEMELSLKAQKDASDYQIKALNHQLDRAFLAIEQLQAQLEIRKTDIHEREKMSEEARLAVEAEANLANPPQPEQPAGPAASITIVNAPQSTPPILPVL